MNENRRHVTPFRIDRGIGPGFTGPQKPKDHLPSPVKDVGVPRILTPVIGARAYLSGNQSIGTGAWTSISVDAINYDTGAMFSSGRLTAKSEGFYIIQADLGFALKVEQTKLLGATGSGTVDTADLNGEFSWPLGGGAAVSYNTTTNYVDSGGDTLTVDWNDMDLQIGNMGFNTPGSVSVAVTVDGTVHDESKDYRGIRIRLNGGSILAHQTSKAVDSQDVYMNCGAMWYMKVGDYVDLQAIHSYGSNIDAYSGAALSLQQIEVRR